MAEAVLVPATLSVGSVQAWARGSCSRASPDPAIGRTGLPSATEPTLT